MANDRIWVRCVHCKEIQFVDKYYPSMNTSPAPEKLAAFIAEHLDRCAIPLIPGYSANLGVEPFQPFEFVAEGGFRAGDPNVPEHLAARQG